MFKPIYFGEIAGKHSDICGDLDEKDVRVISDVEEVLTFLTNYPNGHDYNYSFIQKFLEGSEFGEFEDITKTVWNELNNFLIKQL